MLLLFSFFFFSCYCHHRDLHSFPTRRSSDLHARDLAAFYPEKECAWKSQEQYGLQEPTGLARISRRMVPAGHTADRKSTRLNSSHVSISYAVFCLKKKKITNLCIIRTRSFRR